MKKAELIENIGAEIGPENGKTVIVIYAKDANSNKAVPIRKYSYNSKTNTLTNISKNSIPESNQQLYKSTVAQEMAEIKKYVNNPKYNQKFVSPLDLHLNISNGKIKVMSNPNPD